jgi:hypothetical protein
MRYINLTPHDINLNNGDCIPASGQVARISSHYGPVIDGVAVKLFGEVQGLPTPQGGVTYIVSGMILERTNRIDVVAPATDHPDTVRNDKGHVVSVPCFTRLG